MTLFEELAECRRKMKDATEQLPQLINDAANAEAQYQAAKAKRALELKAQGMTVTLIQTIIKGDEQVNALLMKRDCAQGILNATNKAIDTYKLDCRLIEKQIDREWRG